MNEELQRTLTALLSELGGADQEAWGRVLPVVYDQLKAVARKIAGAGSDSATITPTALVHDAWAKLSSAADFEAVDREHFFAIAAVTMRRVLVDAARRKGAEKRGGGCAQVTIADVAMESPAVDLVELDEALDQLEALSPRQSRIVELRFFAGLTVPEVADCLGVSVATVVADWRLARAWLGRRL